MSQTTISTNAAQTQKIYSVMLFVECQRRSVFLNLMAAKRSTQAMALAKAEKVQTSADMPIVIIDDLSKMAGDKVTMDMFHDMNGEPFMGSEVIEGKGGGITFDTFEMTINQMRQVINTGDVMAQKRISHNLRKIAKTRLRNWFVKTNDQITMCHLAGARGDEVASDWTLPLDTHPKFARIMVNTVRPPSTNRYFVAGMSPATNGKPNVGDIDTTDALTLTDFDVLKSHIAEMVHPPAPFRIANDALGNEQFIYCAMVSERQWHYIETASGQNSPTWRSFLVEAEKRQAMFRHPLFNGDCGMWNGFLIKKMPRPVRFKAGSVVKTTDSDDGTIISTTISNTTFNNTADAIDRCIILGGQALAIANGNGQKISDSPVPMRWSEVELDHGNSAEIAGAQMGGQSKIHFANDSDGKRTDWGVIIMDSYAPDPASARGNTLRTTLST